MADFDMDGDDTPVSGHIVQSAPNVVGQEVNQQIATANRYPRPGVSKIIQEAIFVSTASQKVAEDCIYTLTRRNRQGEQVSIVGPSVRFAEIIQYCYRNLRIQSSFERIDSSRSDRVCVVAMCGVMDLERNVGLSTQSTRSVMTSPRNGKPFLFSPDMIATTINAAQSIAFRNAILRLVPKAIWVPVHDAVIATIEGDPKTLSDRRSKMFAAFKQLGVASDQILRVLGVEKEEHIRLADMPRLTGMYSAIKDGEDPEEVFGRNTAPSVDKDKASGRNPLGDAPHHEQGQDAQGAPQDDSAEMHQGADQPDQGPLHEEGEASSDAPEQQDQAAKQEDKPKEHAADKPKAIKDRPYDLAALISEMAGIDSLTNLANWWKSKRDIRKIMSDEELSEFSSAYEKLRQEKLS